MQQPNAGFAHGIEFEETFPEVEPAPVKAAAPAPAAPRLTVVRSEPAVKESEAAFQEQLERRLRDAEAMVKQTIETVRLEEEKRLAEWVSTRRAEEEQRLAKWAEERRSALERSIEQRSMSTDGVVRRVEEMLSDFQERFEQRLDKRRSDDERLAERQRINDEERLRAWRGELEGALDQRANHRQLVAGAGSARDVELIHTSAFALAVHHDRRDEVAYRYRVASDDEVGQLLRRDSLDDGRDSAVAYMNTWVRAQRTARVGTRNLMVHTAQVAVRDRDVTIGVLTLQSEGRPIDDTVLARVGELAAAAAPRLAALREAGSLLGA